MSEILIAVVSLVAGGVLSYWIAVRHKPKKSLHHFMKDFDLLDKQALGIGTELKMDFLGNPVDQIRLCRMFLWNSGSVCVQGGEIARKDRIRILAPSAHAISLISTHPSRGAIDFNTKIQSNEIELTFDILDTDDWVELRFIYDRGLKAQEHASTRPTLSGSVAGIPNGIAYVDLLDSISESHWSGKLKALFVMIAPLSMAVTTYAVFEVFSNRDETAIGESMLGNILPWGMLMITAFVFLFALVYLYSRWQATRVKIPRAIWRAIVK